MVVMKQQLVVSRDKTYAGTNGRKYITIHETANTSQGANAQAHANLQSKGFSASWHYTVDDKQAIQSFPHTVRCWHAGDGRGTGNYESIGIEICVNSDGDFAKAVSNAAKLVRHIMKQENIPIQNVVQHNKWSGKNCPSTLRKGSNWAGFIQELRRLGEEKPVEKPEIFKPTSPTVDKAVQDVLYSRARRPEADKPISDDWRKKYIAGQMTTSDALGLVFVLIDRKLL